jgi:hypothetical protein
MLHRSTQRSIAKYAAAMLSPSAIAQRINIRSPTCFLKQVDAIGDGLRVADCGQVGVPLSSRRFRLTPSKGHGRGRKLLADREAVEGSFWIRASPLERVEKLSPEGE